MEKTNLQAKYEAQYAQARGNLLAMLLLTLVNVGLMIAEAEVSFLFSAIFPQVVISYGWYLDAWLGGSTYTLIAYGISLMSIVLFALCYFLSKKHRGWMTTALVLFILDCIVLVYWIYLGFMIEDVLDILFHLWILFYLIMGVRAAARLKNMPTPKATQQEQAKQNPEVQETVLPGNKPESEKQQPKTEQVEEQQETIIEQQTIELERQPDFGPQPPMGPQPIDGEDKKE